MYKNILITGGCGFIGRHIAQYHINNRDHVTIVDNLSTSELNNIPGVDLIIGDLTTLNLSTEMLQKQDLVYHFASSVGVQYIDNAPGVAVINNHLISTNLLPQFENAKCRVIFASTSEVYGNTRNAKEIDSLVIGSTDKLRWGYACNKLMTEFLMRSYTFPSTVVRFFNVTGTGQLHDHGMVLPTFVHKAKHNQEIVVHGTGKQVRSFCDIRDALQMIINVTGEESIGETYNIGNSDNIISILDLAKLVVVLTKSKSKIIFKSHEDCFTKEFEDINTRSPCIDKISRYYWPKYNIEDIIKSMI